MNTHSATVESLLVHREWVRGLARRLVLDDARADDLAQQTWLRALTSPPPSGTATRAWLGTIARNLARDLARRRERRARRELAAAHPEALPATIDVVGRAEALGRVVQAVVALDEPYRTTVLLRFFEGLSPGQVAQRMDVPVETVRTRLRRALERLRSALDDSYRDEGSTALPALLALAHDPASASWFSPVSRTLLRRGTAALVVLVVGGVAWRMASDDGGALVPAAPVEIGAAPRAGAGPAAVAAPDRAPRRAETVAQGGAATAPAIGVAAASVGDAPAVRADPVRVEPRPEDATPPDVLRPAPRPPAPKGDAADATPEPTPVVPPLPPYADAETAAWEARYEKQLDQAVRDVTTLADWCGEHGLEWTRLVVLRRVLRYRPDDVAARSALGYLRQGDGWVGDEAARDRLRTSVVDDEDPAGDAFVSAHGKLQKRLSDAFVSSARQAERAAEHIDEPGAKAAWTALAARAWERVLEIDPGIPKHHAAAHAALGHPQFAGRYVTPTQLRYMTRRADRLRRGAALRATEPESHEVSAKGGLLERAGIDAQGVATAHLTVFSAWGRDVAARQARAAERALADGIAEYGFPESVLERLQLRTLFGVKADPSGGRADLVKALTGAGWDEQRIRKSLDAGFGGMPLSATDQLMTTTDGADAEDFAMNVVHAELARAAAGLFGAETGRRLASPEDWLWQSMGYDCTDRVAGTTLTVWGALGDYARRAAPRPGQNVWIELARQQVESDDDVPLSRLVLLDLSRQEFRGPELVKGFAFLRFLLEDDAEAAREFVRLALPLGTPSAAMRVYGPAVLGDATVAEAPAGLATPAHPGPLPEPYRRVLDDLDRRYRAWIVRGW